MKFSKRETLTQVSSFIAPFIAAAMLVGCDSGSGGSAATDTASNSSASPSTSSSGNTNADTGANTGSNDSGSNGGNDSGVVGTSCASDSSKICLGVHFVTYKNSSGNAVASTDQAIKIIGTMNQLWGTCGIAFQIDQYDAVNPTDYGLSYGAQSQNETNSIRTTFAQPSNELLAVTTGPWGTAVNAWTNMPGGGPYGAVMEASIVDYGGGIIYAHEFGHYLGLDHVSDTSNLMDAIIYTSSTTLTSSQCQTAKSTAQSYWAAMIRNK